MIRRPARPLYIQAAGGISWRVDAVLPSLREPIQELFGTSVRRVNRLIQLALVGAGRCVRGASLDARCGLYLASGQGALADSVDVFTQMFIDGQPPKPISFVNTLSNTSCFYVAKGLGLCGTNQFVSASALPFESALSLAILDLERGRIDQALVGGVDECVLPLADHRKRLRTPPDAPLGEGSHWLLLGREPRARSLGRLLEVREHPDAETCAKWLDALAFDTDRCHVAFGPGVDARARAQLAPQLGAMTELDYRPRAAYYETVSAAGICGFLQTAGAATASAAEDGATLLIHLNASAEGRFAACIVQRGDFAPVAVPS